MATSAPDGVHGRLASRSLVVGAGAALALAGSVALVGERGDLGALVPRGAPPAIAGLTVDDGVDSAMPVVTSLRSGGEAARRGLRVGDRIAQVDGRPVRDAAALRRAVRAAGAHRPIAIDVRRGDAVWTVALDRVEADADDPERHGPQDPAD